MTEANRLRVGGTWHSWSPAFSFLTQAVDATNDGAAFAFQTKTTAAITHLGIRIGTRTGTPPTYLIALEGIDLTTGNPNGTVKGGGTPASATFTPPADTTWDATWQWIALTNSYTPTIGELLALTVRYSSGTIDASNRITVAYTNQAGVNRYGFPYAVNLTAGSWSGGKSSSTPVFGYRTASGRHGHICRDFYSTRSASTVGNRVAAKFNLDAGFGNTFKISSIKFTASDALAGGKNPILKIWDATTALASYTLDSDVESAVGSTVMTYEFAPTTQPTLSFGTTYYVGFEIADAANGGIILNGIQVAEAADLSNEDGGLFTLATYNGSVWADDLTVRPWIELQLADITEPSGGGGSGGSFTFVR